MKTAPVLYDRTFTQKYLTLQRQHFTKRADPARTFLYRAVEENLKPGRRILDVGCGDGQDVNFYRSLGYETWGIDCSETMVAAARDNVALADRIVLDDFLAVRASRRFGRFDCITTRFALHYLQSIDAGYKQFAEMLHPGGLLVVVTSHPFADALFSKKPRRSKPRIVRYPLFKGKVTVEYPAHTLHEYFSPTFFKLFDLLAVDEEPEKFWAFPNCPGHLGILARRKPL